jgi:hypothetical protein
LEFRQGFLEVCICDVSIDGGLKEVLRVGRGLLRAHLAQASMHVTGDLGIRVEWEIVVHFRVVVEQFLVPGGVRGQSLSCGVQLGGDGVPLAKVFVDEALNGIVVSELASSGTGKGLDVQLVGGSTGKQFNELAKLSGLAQLLPVVEAGILGVPHVSSLSTVEHGLDGLEQAGQIGEGYLVERPLLEVEGIRGTGHW